MSETKQFRSIIGFIQFPPREGKAGGKEVRNIVVRQTGVHEKESVRVSATVWPSHEDVALAEGDLVALDGSYTVNVVTKDDGAKVTYHNLSVTKLAVLGSGNAGARPAVENTPAADETAEEDLPF